MSKSSYNNKKKIAIFISYRSPKEGGGYTITMDILDQILLKTKKKKLLLLYLMIKKNTFIKKLPKRDMIVFV
jgi:hypothetical protein